MLINVFYVFEYFCRREALDSYYILMKNYVENLVIGAGLYGLYSALYLAKKNKRVLVLEKDSEAFSRATYINQARVHMGYHYPRSISTAGKSAHYFNRFMKDYDFSILTKFDQIYATSSQFSWTNAGQFQKFCQAAQIKCEEINPKKYFKGNIDGAFLTEEYTYDAFILRDYFLSEISKYNNVEIKYNANIKSISKSDKYYELVLNDDNIVQTDFLLNATYASTNQISSMLDFEPFKIKYELCEIILCNVVNNLKEVGLTVMDGPFFSIMPFGKTVYHSLTSVTFTPHKTSYENLPTFDCQKINANCLPSCLDNCNLCAAKPKTAWEYMSHLARKYMNDDLSFEYVKSLFSMKPILKASEIDDSRPTVIRTFSTNPTYIAVLSGKINTVYDLDEVLDNA